MFVPFRIGHDFAIPFVPEDEMPEKSTIARAKKDARQGKSPSTQAGEFVKEEIDHVREGKHGARSTKQAITIGLSKARRSGVKVPAKKGRTSAGTRKKAAQDSRASKRPHEPSRKRARAVTQALGREGHEAASSGALSRQAKSTAARRSKADRSASAKKAARTRKRTAARKSK
jgi:hypothetical protein